MIRLLLNQIQRFLDKTAFNGFSRVSWVVGKEHAEHIRKMGHALHFIGLEVANLVEREVQRGQGVDVSPLDPRKVDHIQSTLAEFAELRNTYMKIL